MIQDVTTLKMARSAGNLCEKLIKLIILLVLIPSQTKCELSINDNELSNPLNNSRFLENVNSSHSEISNSTMLRLFSKTGRANTETNLTNQIFATENTAEGSEYKQNEEEQHFKMKDQTEGNVRGDGGIEKNLNNVLLSSDVTSEELEMSEEFSDEVNEAETAVETIDDVNNPDSALSGFYSDCLLGLSFTCVQRKMLVYIDKLNRVEKYELLGDYLSLVRLGKASRRPKMTEENLSEPRMTTFDSMKTLDSLLDYSIKKFFFTHAIRMKVPPWFEVGMAGSKSMSYGGKAVRLSLAPLDPEEGKNIYNIPYNIFLLLLLVLFNCLIIFTSFVYYYLKNTLTSFNYKHYKSKFYII